MHNYSYIRLADEQRCAVKMYISGVRIPVLVAVVMLMNYTDLLQDACTDKKANFGPYTST